MLGCLLVQLLDYVGLCVGNTEGIKVGRDVGPIVGLGVVGVGSFDSISDGLRDGLSDGFDVGKVVVSYVVLCHI